MKDIKITVIAFLVFSLALLAQGSIYNDPAAIAGFTNKTTFNITMDGQSLQADVEYAVYAPGDYTGHDLSGGNEYVYAYQIFNSSQSNVTVDFFSIGIMSGSYIDFIYTDTTYGTAGGNDPFAFNFPQSAGYAFISNSINPGQWSSVLVFTSIYSPMEGFGTISGGGLGDMGAFATPSLYTIPEPATIGVLALGAFVIPKKRNKKS